jgi:hypothetical protein
MDGSDGTHEDTQDTTRLVQIEEVKRAIRALPFVTKLSDSFVTNGSAGRCAQRQGGWVGGLPDNMILTGLLCTVNAHK